MIKMKGISCCGDCGYYNWKKHKCTRATDEGDARSSFYADCPLPDVVPTIDAIPVEWLQEKMLKPQMTGGNPFGFVLAEWLDEQEAR